MPFKIRTKLLSAFFAIIIPFIVIGAILVLYSADTIHKSVHKVKSLAEERAVLTNLIIAMEEVLMPGNDYIITGNKKYIDDFYKVSDEVEKRMKVAKGILHDPAEEGKILDDTNIAWQGVKEISLKIFAISNPAGNRDAAMLMEEMDYKWAYPAIKRLIDLREMHIEEFQKAAKTADKVWMHSWIIMISGTFVSTAFGIFFAFFYSRRFSGPIEKIHHGADAIAGGDFKTRLDIKTGDELEQLANAMNEMAEQLDSFYGTLERQVEERTKELKEAEEKYRTMIETSNDWIWTLTPDGRLTFINKQADDVSGYSKEEWLGKTFEPLILEDDLAMVVDIHNKVVKGEKAHYEVRIKKRDGGVVILSVNASPIFKDDKVTGTISFGRDITERKEAESRLKETRDYLDNLFNYANAPIIVWNPVFRITRFNHAFEHFTGYKADEVIGKELGLLFPDASRKDSMDNILRTSGGEFWESVEIPIIRKDGDIRISLWNSANIYAEDGKTLMTTIAQGQDITERKKADEALKESETRYKGLIESVTDYIFTVEVKDGGPVKTTHGQGCVAITGYASKEYETNPNLWLQMVYEGDRNAVVRQGETVLSGKAEPLEHRIITKGGRIKWVRNVPVPHYDEKGQMVAYDGLISDITERKEAENRLKETRDYLDNLFNYANAPIIVWNPAFRITRFNHAFEHFTGYKADEVIGKELGLLFPEASQKESMEKIISTSGGEFWDSVEIPIIRKDGDIRIALWNSANIYAEDGKTLIATIAQGQNFTERKKSEEALGRAKREWEATFDGITDSLFIHDKDFKVVRANKAYAEAAGMEFKEFIGRPYYEVFPKMDGPFKMCMKAQELQEEEEEEFSCPLTNRIFKVRFYPIKDVNGGYLYSIHILEDITEAKRAEEQIKEEMSVTNHLLMIAEATIHTTDIDKLMEQVVHCAHEVIRCDICLSYLWDEESKVFQPCQEFGLSYDMIPVFRTELIDENIEFVKKAVEGREPVVENHPQSYPKGHKPFYKEGDKMFPPLAKGGEGGFLKDISTLSAAIPLIGKTGTLGLIVGIYSHPVELTERDKKIMVGISQQASVALEQARLYTESVDKTMELSHKIETIRVMHEIDRSILSTLKAEEVLETVMRLLAKVIPCERATVVLVDMERDGIIYKAGFGTGVVPKGAFVPFADTSAKVLVETGRTECVNNLSEVTPLLPIEKRFLDEGFLSHIRVPITIKGDVAGILTVGAKRVAAFTKENLSTLEYLCSQIGVALSNARLISDLEELFIGVVKSLSSAIDAKSPWTAGHSERVTKYAMDIAKEMKLGRDEMRSLELAGLLHDVGKIGTYDILLDKPGKLEPDEVEIVRRHPGKGAEILEPIRRFKNIIPAIKHHHEFYNGAGYPDRLKGEEIPLLARILAVADTFDAMKADRPYRPGRTMEFILEEFKRCSGTQFDPKVVEAFLKTVSQ